MKALLPQSMQGPTHEDWQRFHAQEATARARGEGYIGPTPDQNAKAAAALLGPIEIGSMLPFGAMGVMKGAAPIAMAAARKVVPMGERAAEALETGAMHVLHPDAKRGLIDMLYGDAAAKTEAQQLSAIAADTHRMEQEHGIWLVKDPESRKRMGLPPIPKSK